MTEVKPGGLFITFEGGEGAGKSTLIDSLCEFLSKKGLEVIKTREPGGTWLGEQIREVILDAKNQGKICDYAELLLFLTSRAQHIEDVIKPALKAGKIVLCDRFNDSTVAYQGGGRLLGIGKISRLCESVCGSPAPDCTIFLDVDISTGIQRTAKTDKSTSPTGQVDRIEAEEKAFHERVREAYLMLASAESDRIHTVDANKSKEEVFYQSIKILELLEFTLYK